jgi:hypothetical protein
MCMCICMTCISYWIIIWNVYIKKNPWMIFIIVFGTSQLNTNSCFLLSRSPLTINCYKFQGQYLNYWLSVYSFVTDLFWLDNKQILTFSSSVIKCHIDLKMIDFHFTIETKFPKTIINIIHGFFFIYTFQIIIQ